MRLEIQHETVYRYEHPLRFSAQYLRLTPYSNVAQHVLNWDIRAQGQITPWRDAYGNHCHTLVCEEPLTEVRVVAGGLVETSDTAGVLPYVGGLPIGAFLRSTPLTAADAAIRDLAEPLRDVPDRIAALHSLAQSIAERVDYRSGGSDVTSTAAEILEAGQGVCQDMAHLFLAAARSIGIPARYVSGYLNTGELGDANMASHAWAAGWVDDLGWLAFDIANQICPTDAHVGLAIGLDYTGAAPIRGVRHGVSQDEIMETQIRVTQA